MDHLEVGEFTEQVFVEAIEYGEQFDLCDIQHAVEVTVIALMSSEDW